MSAMEITKPKLQRMTKLEYLRCFKKQKFTSNDKSIGSKMESDLCDAIKCEEYLNPKNIMGTKEKIQVQRSIPRPPLPIHHRDHSYVGSSTKKTKEEDGNSNMAREKVMKILRIVRLIYDNFVMENRSGETSHVSVKRNRPDLRAAEVIEKKFGKCSPSIGSIPGVQIGDKFNFRVELTLVGLHMPLQCGIATIDIKKFRICTSIVATGSYYENDMKDPDYLEYSGHGGIVGRSRKKVEDQKLERGNLAMMNSIRQKNPVRVIRQKKEKDKSIFIYDGLYMVENCREVRGSNWNLIFMFGLRRIPGQPKLPKP